MLRTVFAKLASLVIPELPLFRLTPQFQFAGSPVERERWFRKKGVLWFNGYPGVPKLPLVQRRRLSASSLNPVASFTPECEDEGREEEEVSAEDPEPLCRMEH